MPSTSCSLAGEREQTVRVSVSQKHRLPFRVRVLHHHVCPCVLCVCCVWCVLVGVHVCCVCSVCLSRVVCVPCVCCVRARCVCRVCGLCCVCLLYHLLCTSGVCYVCCLSVCGVCDVCVVSVCLWHACICGGWLYPWPRLGQQGAPTSSLCLTLSFPLPSPPGPLAVPLA